MKENRKDLVSDSWSPGGIEMPGVVNAGDDVMANAGIVEGTNQESPCITVREYEKRDRGYIYRAEVGMNAVILRNGNPFKFNHHGDIRCSEYMRRRLFGSDRISCMEVKHGDVPISSPITVTLSTGEIVKGTVSAEIRINASDENSVRNVMDLLNSDYAKTVKFNGEYRRWISCNDLSRILAYQLQQSTQMEIAEFDSIAGLEKVFSEKLVSAMRQYPPLFNRGVQIGNCYVNLQDDSKTILRRYANDAAVRLGKAQIDSATKIGLIKLKMKEYEAVNQV